MLLIGLADSNSFFASCEKVFRPDLKNSPIVVLSNNDGCIIALTQEAKDLGIKRGQPYFKVENQLKKAGVIVFSSNYTLYQDLSKRMFEVLGIFTENIEPYSIDEAFFTMPDYLDEKDIVSFINKLHNTIYRRCGLKVSIGVGRTKTLAKIANHLAKKRGGSFYLAKEKEADVLSLLPVKEVWGIGNRNNNKLAHFGIKFAQELMEKDDKWIRKNFSITGLRTICELKGKACISEDDYRIRSFASSISFQKPVVGFKALLQTLSCHCKVVSSKLAGKNLKAGTIGIEISSSYFKENYYSAFYYIKLTQSTSYSPTFIKACEVCLKQIYKEDVNYKSSRVIAWDFSSIKDRQLELFDNPKYSEILKKRDKMSKCVYALESSRGRNIVHPASTCSKMKYDYTSRKYLSPCYTTNWKDLAKVF